MTDSAGRDMSSRLLGSRLGGARGSFMWLVIVAVVAIAVTTHKSGKAHHASGQHTPAAGQPGATKDAAQPPLTSAQALALAGQHVVYSYQGTTPPASLIHAIRVGDAAGVILFADNTTDHAALVQGVAAMQAAAQASPNHKPLLILTDQEGGAVNRLSGAPTQSEKQIGASTDGAQLAARAGAGAASTLRSAGVNVNLAPVVDVYRQAGNFIDEYGRSYSSRASVVSPLGGAFITAQQKAGVAATAKHFPGLGSATRTQNTDDRPVQLDVPLSQLRSVDEAPYRTAISAGVRLVMLSWAVYPALDRSRPAGLSSRVIGSELRGRLHFGGVTITDGIDAGALSRYGSIGARSVLALGAGDDLILACAAGNVTNSPALGNAAVHAIARALVTHRLSASAVRRSSARVLALRASP